MARTTIGIQYRAFPQVRSYIDGVLHSSGYQELMQDNEVIWKKGIGFLTAIKYMKVEFGLNNMVYLSGWIQVVGGTEQDLNGFAAGIPKKQVLNLMQRMQMEITQNQI